MKAIKVKDFDEAMKIGPGAFWFDREGNKIMGLTFVTPDAVDDGRGFWDKIGGVHFKEHGWLFDGNEDAPTVTPSIFVNMHTPNPGWHGYLTKGEWIKC